MATRLKALAWAALVAAAVSGQAAAQEPRDNRIGGFYQTCHPYPSSPEDLDPFESMELIGCMNYIAGVADILKAFGNLGHPAGICDAHYTGETLVGIFRAWAERNGTHWQEDKMIGVIAALQERWPCPDSGGPGQPRRGGGAD